MSPPAPVWRPSEPACAAANLTGFAELASRRSGANLRDYPALHRWSVDQAGEFWRLIWEFCEVRGSLEGLALVNGNSMMEARWFPEARLNFAENLLRRRDEGVAMVFWGEDKVRRSLSWRELYRQVAATAAQLSALGVGPGDRVAAYLPNMPEAAIAMLATASIGAVWSSCSPDFGVQGVLERFGQIEPKVLFACDGYWFNGKRIDSIEKVRQVVRGLPSLACTVIVTYAGASAPTESIPGAVDYARFLAGSSATELSFVRLPFNHPLFILYSSGTTGVPKCIVHGAGGTLLQHLKEHRLHTDVKPGDRLFYATTCGWMMWNWLMSGLASEATLILYDGSPLVGHGSILFDLADEADITHFGTSAKFIDTVAKLGLSPIRTHRLRNLRAVLSTGSPLAPESFDYVYREIKPDLCLSSISGGTDIVSCFVLGAPTLPVWRGEIQCLGLGLSMKVFDEAGRAIAGEKGELVCTRPFPSMPVGFWNDPDGAKYRSAYFARFPGIWCHGDYVELTEHAGVEGMIIYGRSDATLKPGGVRIGTAEIYRQVEQLEEVTESLVIGQEWQNDTRIVLFVKLREGLTLDRALSHRIREHIRSNTSPAHVPAKVLQVGDIPRTKSNKIVELAVREVVHGRAVKNLEALANPDALDHYRNRPELNEADAQSESAPLFAEDSERPPMHGLEWVEQRLVGSDLPLDVLSPLEQGREGAQAAATKAEGRSTAAASRNWLVLADRPGTAEQLAASLRARGHRCDTYVVGPERAQVRQILTQTLSAVQSRLDGVVCLFSSGCEIDRALPSEALMQAAQASCTRVLDLLQELSSCTTRQSPRLWLVTEDCTPVRGSRLTGLDQAPLRGLALAIAQEHPDLRCAHVDLERQPGKASLEALCDELVADAAEDRIAFRNGVRSVQRIVRWQPQLDPTAARFSSQATYLITGGLGPLGLFFAQWLAEHGARHIALVGRSPPRLPALEALDRLRALGAKLHISQVDVADSGAVTRLFARLAIDAPPLAGVIHAAGVIDDGVLRHQRWERFAPVLAPKIAGAWNLHLATCQMRLEFFVLFSSTAAVLGHAGQANHAAANAFLDSLAHARRAAGWPALSINWGSWARIGVASSREILEGLARQGIRPLAPELGVAAFSQALAANEPEVVVAAVDWQEFAKLRGYSPLIERVLDAPDDDTSTVPFSSQLDTAASEARLEMLTEYVRVEVAQATGIGDAALVDVDRGFFEQGMDSLSSIALRNRLQRGLGRSLPATLAFDYPNIEVLVEFLREQVYGDAYFGRGETQESREPMQSSPPAIEPVAEEMDAAIAEELAQLTALLRPHH